MNALGFESLQSGANFIFTRHKSKSAEIIFKELRKDDILIRFFNSPEIINNFLRITIGTQEQMEQLVKKIESII